MSSIAAVVLLAVSLGQAYPFTRHPEATRLSARTEPPEGFSRVAVEKGSFAAWLRDVPVLPGRPDVHLHDGSRKGNQKAHALVVDLDVGRANLQQCADALIRLRAEYLRAVKREDEICFHFTSGHVASWKEWKRGARPKISGRSVVWSRAAPENASEPSFRRYLDTVFTYAGTLSLPRDLARVKPSVPVELGDVFLQAGSPGHAVLVLDVAERRGERVFLLGQSYMPAQQFHVLKGPDDSPWFRLEPDGPFVTPEWTFPTATRWRFREKTCAP